MVNWILFDEMLSYTVWQLAFEMANLHNGFPPRYSVQYTLYLSYFSCKIFGTLPRFLGIPYKNVIILSIPMYTSVRQQRVVAVSWSLISARMRSKHSPTQDQLERVFKPCFWAKLDHHFHLHTPFAIKKFLPSFCLLVTRYGSHQKSKSLSVSIPVSPCNWWSRVQMNLGPWVTPLKVNRLLLDLSNADTKPGVSRKTPQVVSENSYPHLPKTR